VRYLLLMYEAEDVWNALPAEERRRHIAVYDEIRQDAERNGHLVAADGLAASGQARTVRRRGGRLGVTDGPFAETKEQLGGFYLLDCAEAEALEFYLLDCAEAEALEYAGKLPAAETGSVEVRPVGVPH